MKGHEELINLRKKGLKPPIIFLNDYECKTDWLQHGDYVTVCVAGDDITKLDLRFLNGCTVSISGSSERRAKQLFELAKRVGAVRIGAGSPKNINDQNWMEIWDGMD